MRRVLLSKTFFRQLHLLLEQGYPKFGERVVLEKRDRVFQLIEQHLVRYARNPRDPRHGLCVYPVRRTPFVVIYDFDEEELRDSISMPITRIWTPALSNGEHRSAEQPVMFKSQAASRGGRAAASRAFGL